MTLKEAIDEIESLRNSISADDKLSRLEESLTPTAQFSVSTAACLLATAKIQLETAQHLMWRKSLGDTND